MRSTSSVPDIRQEGVAPPVFVDKQSLSPPFPHKEILQPLHLSGKCLPPDTGVAGWGQLLWLERALSPFAEMRSQGVIAGTRGPW